MDVLHGEVSDSTAAHSRAEECILQLQTKLESEQASLQRCRDDVVSLKLTQVAAVKEHNMRIAELERRHAEARDAAAAELSNTKVCLAATHLKTVSQLQAWSGCPAAEICIGYWHSPLQLTRKRCFDEKNPTGQDNSLSCGRRRLMGCLCLIGCCSGGGRCRGAAGGSSRRAGPAGG